MMPTSFDEERFGVGFSIVDANKQLSTIFDFEAIENDGDKELWMIRVPDEVPTNSLASMRIELSKTAGKPLSRLYVDDKDKYALYLVPEGKTLDADVGVGGHEMLGLSCLVPSRKKKGIMIFAPKGISKCFILNEEVMVPDGTQLAKFIRDRPVVKRQHPKGLVLDRSLDFDLDRFTGNIKDDDTRIHRKRKKAKDSDYNSDKKMKKGRFS